MEMRPEQLRALDYLRRHGTEAPRVAVRQRLVSAFEGLDALLASLAEQRVRQRPSPASWSVQEVVDHLIESHRPAVGQLADLVAGREPAGGAIPAGLQSAAPLDRSWRELVGELKGVHAAFLAAFDRASDATPTEARAPVVMVVKCARQDGTLEPVHWIESFDWKAYALLIRVHALEHRGQIERALAAAAG
jgi:hypothetical protein